MTRTKALGLAGVALCAIGCGLVPGVPVPAAVWNPNFSDTKPNQVRRSEKMDERDMVGIMTSASAYPDGWVTFVVRPEGAKVPFRLVAYDYVNKEVARVASPDGGAASITVPITPNMLAMFRMVPIGSRFDPPDGVGVLYRGEAATAANQIKLPVYSFVPIAVRDASGATAEQFAALAMPADAATRTASAAPLQPEPERRTILGGLLSVPGKAKVAPAANAPPAARTANAPGSMIAGPAAGSRLASGSTAPGVAAGPVAGSVPAAASIAAAPVKSWGALGQMAGTVWTNDIQALQFEWVTPNETMLITRKGLYGEIQTVVSGSADGKGLRYVSRDVYAGDQYEGQISASNGKLALRYDAAGRISCKLPKPGQPLNCDVQSRVGDSWSPSTTAYAVSNAAGAKTMLAALPGVFPPRPAGKYDRKLGPFVYMGTGRWIDPKTAQRANISGGRGASGISLQVAAPGTIKSYLFNEGADGRLVATLNNASDKNPQGTQASVLEVVAGGAARICYNHYGVYCDVWRLSADGRKVMQELNGARYVYEQVALPARDPAKDGLLGMLDERVFRNAQGQTLEFKNYAAPGGPRTVSIMRYRNSGYLQSSCFTKMPDSLHCSVTSQNEGSGREYDAKLTEDGPDRFAYDGRVYMIADNGDLVATSSGGGKEIFKASSAGELAYIQQAYDDSERVRGAYVSRQMAQESRDAFWRGVAQGIAEMPNTMRQWQRDNAFLAPTDWSQRIPAAAGNVGGGNGARVATGGAAGQVGGYAQSMGSTIFVPMAPETPAQRMQREEIERYEIRKRLYGDKDADYGPSAQVKAATAALEASRDEAAKREVARAEDEAKAAEDDARQKEEDAVKAGDEKAIADARKAAAEARETARKAQEEVAQAKAKADADARAEASRKRQEDEALAEKKRIEKAKADEAKRKEDEDKRARAQMAAATVSGEMYYGPFGPRREPQSGPGQGSLSKQVFGIAGCYANGVQVRYNLSGLMGEAVVNGSWSWSSNEKCSLPSNTVVWLKLQSGNAMGYVRLDPAVPAANAGYGYTSASSPAWSQLICSFRGSGPTTCLDEKRAREMWGSAIITGFEIAW
jgi:hypothetical protein